MDTIQWARVMRKAMEEVEGHLEANEEGMAEAFRKGKGKLSISLKVTITSESAYSADVDSSISYVIERVKEGGSQRVIFGQEELPLPEVTKSGKGSFQPKQAEPAKPKKAVAS